MRRFAIFGCLLYLALMLAPTSSAANTCPWLTKGSAEAALGGSVSSKVDVSDSGEGSCTFSLEQGNSKDSLKIVVQKAALPACPEGSPKLKGIGNEAEMCTDHPSPNATIERVVSRVRELHFTVSLALHNQSQESPGAGRPKDVLQQIAEQVAGNLF